MMNDAVLLSNINIAHIVHFILDMLVMNEASAVARRYCLFCCELIPKWLKKIKKNKTRASSGFLDEREAVSALSSAASRHSGSE